MGVNFYAHQTHPLTDMMPLAQNELMTAVAAELSKENQ